MQPPLGGLFMSKSSDFRKGQMDSLSDVLLAIEDLRDLVLEMLEEADG
jgi:hypothetical protein